MQSCSVGSPEHDGDIHLPPGHIKHLGGAVDNLVQGQKGEVEGHELDNGPEPYHRRPHTHPGESQLADGRVDDALLSEALQQALGDLVGAVVLRHFLTHEKDGVVPGQLLGHRLVQGVSIRDLCHLRLFIPAVEEETAVLVDLRVNVGS